MAKTIGIDLGADRLIGIAADMVDDHNYINALKMLNKNAEINGNDEDSYMLYAEIYDDMGLFERSVNGWFKYMDSATEFNAPECYEGLAVNFMNLGNKHFSAFYYNKLLAETDDADDLEREQIMDDFLTDDENPLKFVYPPRLADCTEIIRKGVEHMKNGDFDAAVEEFDKVDEENGKYISARNYIAMCKIIADKTDEAEQECLKLLEKRPDDIQALTTLAAVKTECGKKEEALALAKKLVALNPVNSDDVYKIATVCCENKLHYEAFTLLNKLPEEFDYDLTVMYFKAVSAFNAGMIEESLAAFDKIVTVYPEAVTARYYYNLARQSAEEGIECELGYFYRLPTEMRESFLKMLAAYVRLPQSAAKKLAKSINIVNCILWCFDECEGSGGEELQSLAAHAAVKAEEDDMVRDMLLNAFLPDQLKIDLLTSLCERNRFDCFGAVVCNTYRRVTMQKLDIGRKHKAYFVRAYSRLVARFSILDDDYGKLFASAAEKLYNRLEREQRLNFSRDVDALTAALYLKSGVREAGISGKNLFSFFDVTRQRVSKITGE